MSGFFFFFSNLNFMSLMEFSCSSFHTSTFFIAVASVWAVSTCFDSSAKHVTDKNKMSTKLSNFWLFFGDETSIKPLMLRFAFRALLCPLVVKKITHFPFNDGLTLVFNSFFFLLQSF